MEGRYQPLRVSLSQPQQWEGRHSPTYYNLRVASSAPYCHQQAAAVRLLRVVYTLPRYYNGSPPPLLHISSTTSVSLVFSRSSGFKSHC